MDAQRRVLASQHALHVVVVMRRRQTSSGVCKAALSDWYQLVPFECLHSWVLLGCGCDAFPKLVGPGSGRNLRRCTGCKVQYFAAIEPQHRLARHLHAAIPGCDRPANCSGPDDADQRSGP